MQLPSRCRSRLSTSRISEHSNCGLDMDEGIDEAQKEDVLMPVGASHVIYTAIRKSKSKISSIIWRAVHGSVSCLHKVRREILISVTCSTKCLSVYCSTGMITFRITQSKDYVKINSQKPSASSNFQFRRGRVEKKNFSRDGSKSAGEFVQTPKRAQP